MLTAQNFARNRANKEFAIAFSFAVTISPQALKDLDNIVDWYQERHPSGADRFFRDFDMFLGVMHTFPFSGRERADIVPGLRSHVVHPFIAFFIVNETARTVEIARVLHGYMDFDATDFIEK